MKRVWRWLLVTGLAVASPPTPAAPAPADNPATFTVASANLSDNTTQTYGESGIRILQALKPDIVAIQEFNYPDGPAALVEKIFGRGYFFVRESAEVRLPNGIISRWPIRAWGQWPDPHVNDRRFVWASVELPGSNVLHVISAHLAQKPPRKQLAQAHLLRKYIRRQFPPDEFIVLCGDFNLDRRDSPVLTLLAADFDLRRPPADQEGNTLTSVARTRPYDFVLPNHALAAWEVPTKLGGLIFPDGLVFDTRLWNPPPPPAEWEDTSRNLQHLPVMKTFRIPHQP